MEEETINSATEAVKAVGEGVTEQARNLLHLDEFSRYLTWGNLAKVVANLITIVLMYIVYRIIKKLVFRQTSSKFEVHTSMLINKIISYVFYVIIGMYILSLFGINFKAVWGAAGVAGLAIGFAAQTSVSNFISGMFVLSERAMKIGDFISVGGVSGTVDSVGLLSVKIHTPDNQMIRIPNSVVINSNLMNYSHFGIRRFLFEISISYETDLAHALEVIAKVPEYCPTVLKDPAPSVFYDGFGDAVNLKLAVWFDGADLIQTKNDVYINVVKLCNENNVQIPYTRYDIKIVDDKSGTPAPVAKAAEKVTAKTTDKTESKTTRKTTARAAAKKSTKA